MGSRKNTTIAVLSDIHANLQALQAVMHDIRNGVPQCDEIFILGDVLAIGPQPRECIDLLRTLKTASFVMGNNDRYVATRVFEKTGVTFHTDLYAKIPDGLLGNLRWTHERLGTAELSFIKSWQRSFTRDISGRRICVSHASPDNDEENILPLLADPSFQKKYAGFDGYVFGHTHLSCTERIGTTLYLNPGSVGGPFDRDTRASYAVMEIGAEGVSAQIRRVAYDIDETFGLLKKLSVPWYEEIITVMKRASLH